MMNRDEKLKEAAKAIKPIIEKQIGTYSNSLVSGIADNCISVCVDFAKSEAARQYHNEWIAFCKTIPAFSVSVLACDSKDGYCEVVDIQEIEDKICLCTSGGYSLLSDSKFTHWQPLPPAPKD